MKAILLLAGYATRLYPLTINRPKALLPLKGRPILDYIFDEIETIDAIDEVLLVTNHKFHRHFNDWKLTRTTGKSMRIIDDGSTSDEDRLGAIGDIRFALHECRVRDDVMILAGDNFFTFQLLDFYNFYKIIEKDCLCAHRVEDPELLKRMGVAVLDPEHRVVCFEEKPQHPKSDIAVDAIYIYRQETLPLFDEYLLAGNIPDAPGYFPAWLYKTKDVYAYTIDGSCIDIGTPECYRQVQEMLETDDCIK